jgi:hypothetical protein
MTHFISHSPSRKWSTPWNIFSIRGTFADRFAGSLYPHWRVISQQFPCHRSVKTRGCLWHFPVKMQPSSWPLLSQNIFGQTKFLRLRGNIGVQQLSQNQAVSLTLLGQTICRYLAPKQNYGVSDTAESGLAVSWMPLSCINLPCPCITKQSFLSSLPRNNLADPSMGGLNYALWFPRLKYRGRPKMKFWFRFVIVAINSIANRNEFLGDFHNNVQEHLRAWNKDPGRDVWWKKSGVEDRETFLLTN